MDLQSGRGDRDRLLARRQQHQAAGVLLIAGPRDPAVGGPGRHAGDDLQPVRVGVLVQHGDLAAAGVHAEDPHGSLVPALHHDQRVVPVLPAGGHQVREGGPVHLDRHAGALERGQVHGHVGVRGAGRGIGHHRGRALGVRGIGDVPPVHGRLVRPGDQQGRAVRGPPVAAHAAHLLGGDELRQAERHAGRAPRVREDPVPTAQVGAASQIGHPQRALADVRQPPPGRVQAWIQRGRARGHLAGPRISLRRTGRAAARAVTGQRHREHAAGQREGGHGDVPVGRVGHDAAGLLPDPLAPGPFLRRQVLLPGAVAVRAERPRVGGQPFLPGGHVQHPQARHRIGAALGPQVDDPVAVRRDAEGARHPEAEPPGSGLLPGKALGHDVKSSQLGSVA